MRARAIVLIALLALAGRDAPAHADAPPGRYSALDCSGTPCVKDNVTGLTWKRDEEFPSMTWTTASTACVAPFRLPTVKELQTILDMTKPYGPYIDTTALNIVASRFWASTADARTSGYHWKIDFASAESYGSPDTFKSSVRCVK